MKGGCLDEISVILWHFQVDKLPVALFKGFVIIIFFNHMKIFQIPTLRQNDDKTFLSLLIHDRKERKQCLNFCSYLTFSSISLEF